MNIEVRKLAFIEEFLKIQNEDLILRFEKVLNETKTANKFSEIVAYTVQGESLNNDQYIKKYRRREWEN